MKQVLKWGGVALGALIVLIGAAVAYVLTAFPKVGAASELKIQPSPELSSRGEYLAKHVTVCLDCHGERDWSRFTAPPKDGTLGSGGEYFPREAGFPGSFYSKNITPAGIGGWSDGEVARAVTTGVTKEGRAMFPLMPYLNYSHLCEHDLQSIIAFLRTLAPVPKTVPETELDFPMNLIVRMIPKAAEPWDCPAPGSAEQGKYLTTIAGCGECHTMQDKGKKLPGMDFAGGWKFPLPNGNHVTSANITPDKETGIGGWTKESFVQHFKAFTKPENLPTVAKDGPNTIMPWSMYGGMSDEDLGAIFDFLMTQKPVHHEVHTFAD